MNSFKDLLQETLKSQIKQANEDTADLLMREIKKLKHSERHKFKRKANEDQYKFSLKLRETARQRQVRRANVLACKSLLMRLALKEKETFRTGVEFPYEMVRYACH